MANIVPDRGQNPKRRVKYSDMNVEVTKPSGAIHISHMGDDNHLFSRRYYGYTKKEAMKQHKDAYEKGK
jgi:hypothetical protein